MFQLGAALLDACVLAVVDRADSYGYQLTQNVRDAFDVSESTLYPVLRRLQSGNLLTAYDQPFNGRNRRYYRITSSGKTQLGIYQQGWYDYRRRVDKILLGSAESQASATSPDKQQPKAEKDSTKGGAS